MKVFLDVNIIISAIIKTDPLYKYAIRILSLPRSAYKLYTSSVSLAIAFYFSSKKYSEKKAKQDIELLIQFLNITDCGAEVVQKAITDKKVEDLEDGIQHYSALSEGCTCIITEDLEDFYFSKIEVLTCLSFLKKYG